MSPAGKQGSGLRVLLVTTSDEEVRTLGRALHQERMVVTRARDLAGALEALLGESFDAVLVSHPLPDADVIASCAALRQVEAAPPLILLDALDLFEQTLPGSIRPARLLRKPVDAAKLGTLVREVVTEGGADAAVPAASTAPLALAAALLQLASTRETGVLDVAAGEVRTRIYFRTGAPVSCEGGSLRETLGRMLLRRGALAEADYVRVIERMTEQMIENEQQRMGEVLVELGLLTGDEVRRALEAQLFEKVTACFQSPSSHWTFSELDELPPELEPFELPPVEQLVLRGLRDCAPVEAVNAWLAAHGSAKPRLARSAAQLQERLALDAAPLRLVERIDGNRTVAQLAREAPFAPALLATLLLVDALELGAGAPPKPRPRETVRVPFAREVVGRRKGAPATPGAASAPPATNRSQDRLEAEQCYRRAQQLLAAEKPLEAAKLLRRAVELEPSEPEYAMFEAWTAYLESRQAVRVARARALTNARKMLEADPKAARVHTILGRLALDEGDRERATRELELALLHDPEDAEAKRFLKQVRG